MKLEQACLSTRSFAARTDISLEGDQPTALHIVLDGWAARYKVLRGGRRHISALLLPGDLCDMGGLILQQVHSGVGALTTCMVAVLSHARVRELMDGSPAIRDALWWLFCVETAITSEWAVSLGRRSAVARMAHLLCELLFRLAPVGLSLDKGYMLPLTQSELGDALGLSAVHVNRALQELRAEGMITLEKRRLTIHDRDALKARADFSPAYLHLEGQRPSSSIVHL